MPIFLFADGHPKWRPSCLDDSKASVFVMPACRSQGAYGALPRGARSNRSGDGGLSAPTVNTALADLENLGIVDEVTGRKRGRVFSYRKYLAILSEGTDPLPAT